MQLQISKKEIPLKGNWKTEVFWGLLRQLTSPGWTFWAYTTHHLGCCAPWREHHTLPLHSTFHACEGNVAWLPHLPQPQLTRVPQTNWPTSCKAPWDPGIVNFPGWSMLLDADLSSEGSKVHRFIHWKCIGSNNFWENTSNGYTPPVSSCSISTLTDLLPKTRDPDPPITKESHHGIIQITIAHGSVEGQWHGHLPGFLLKVLVRKQ